MERRGWKSTATYVGLLAAAFVVAVAGSWKFGKQLDDNAYDFMFRLYQPPPWQAASAVLAIDESTLNACGGMPGIRRPLADSLRLLAAARPQAVAVDVILAARSPEPQIDSALAAAFQRTPNLVLASELLPDGWESPIPEFARYAKARGHVYAKPDDDGIARSIPLEKAFRNRRLWALSLEAFRLGRGAEIVESPSGLQVGALWIPIPKVPSGWRHSRDRDDSRFMRVRFAPRNADTGADAIPRIGMQQLIDHPALASSLTGKVVFVGLTAVTELHDRLPTPVAPAIPTSGIEINAGAFETMAQGLFITDASPAGVLLFSLLLLAGAGLSFRYLPGWWAYCGALAVLAAAHIAPYLFFTRGKVFSFVTPASVAWFGSLTAAAYYHLVVRRYWHIEQQARTRYQQAMQFVTHEMRTPLSAIQGSSELISRYSLSEEKRKQVANVIHSESKRLARMVEVFLSVERLSAGQMELKQEAIPVGPMLATCVERARPLADRKHIALTFEPIADGLLLTGDRELMEYACYNLLSNAIKYSPQRTQVTVAGWKGQGDLRIAVKDHGIGMDQREVKQIFQKFYRTRKAEESGEAGSGIGLAIVQQIIEQHGGVIEVVSQPGAGSCFTLVLPAAAPVAASDLAQEN